MSTKYYICNEIRFLIGTVEGATCPSSASHMKMSRAVSYIDAHPKYTYFKERNTSRGNDYVISTPMKFVGNNQTIVNEIKKAKSFSSPEAAYEYLDNYRNDIDGDIQYVITEKFVRKPRLTNMAKLSNPVESASCSKYDTSERIYLPDKRRETAFKESNGICAICGKPIYKTNYTVDHILPLSRGGTNAQKNLRAVHEKCNKLKGNFTDEELAKSIADVCANAAYNNPEGDLIKYLARTMVRGVLAKVGVAN